MCVAFIFKINLFIFGCVGSSLLRAAFSSYERGLLFVVMHRLVTTVASLVAEHRL